MNKSKEKASIEYSGKWMRLKIPIELHTNIRVDSIRERKNLDTKVLEYLHLGYDVAHKNREGINV